jgi:integrase
MAEQVLSDLERQAERIKAGVISPGEESLSQRRLAPISEHIDAFTSTLTGSAVYRGDITRYLNRLVTDCEWSCLADLRRSDLERWLADQTRLGRSARSLNAYREAMMTFCNWCARDGRLSVNPFDKLPKANTDADPHRKRRALTEEEIGHLLDVALRRPVLDAQRINRGPRRGQRVAKLSDARRSVLEAQGRSRVIAYRTLLLTGLRVGELARLRVADLNLDGHNPHIQLPAKITKNGEEAFVPIRPDLVTELKAWLAERFGPGSPPADGIVFEVPAGFLRIFNRDLSLAGIPKSVERGRTVDLHALRTTFGTLLSKCGVPPRVAQRLMRHSDIRLTMQTYTYPALFDLHGAVASLPSVAPSVAQTAVNLVQRRSSPVNQPSSGDSPQTLKNKGKRLIS